MKRSGLAALVLLSVAALSGLTWAGTLDPELEAELSALPPGGMVSVIVELEQLPFTDLLTAGKAARKFGRAAQRKAVKDALKNWARPRQKQIGKFLARGKALGTVAKADSLWIINGFAVTAAEPVIRQVAARKGVKKVRRDKNLPPPEPTPADAEASTGISEWNIAQIGTPDVWALDPTYTGAGTVVGSFDTGVDGTHPDLASRYRGNDAISWFDPYGEHASPFDLNGHGTHTTGIMVGGDAGGTHIGVAPGATWIAAKGWNDIGFAFTSSFHQIFEWFLAPGGDPANAPDVVNMSWAIVESGCFTEFLPDIQALRAAGIFPAVAAANEGPGAGSVRSPGAYAESFAVGATDFFDTVASFSGRGPSPCDGTIKPDVSAPGVSILSALPGGYASFSGTSMATPHIAGAVAVLRSIDPTLTVDELESALADGAVDLGVAGPDNDYGTGRIDLLVSAQIVLGGSGSIVTITATDPTATEAGPTPGTLTVSRSGDTSADLTVPYTVSGSATPGADYVALPGDVTIPAGSDTATISVTPIDDSLAELDETVVVALSTDPAYIVGSPGSATVTITSDEALADLIVSAFSAPATADAGATISVTDTTKNQGGVAGGSTTRFYLSTDATLDGSDVSLGSRSVSSLGAGASSTAATSVTIPASTAAGFYYLIAKADADDTLTESAEGNNTALAGMRIGPDLLIFSLSAPTTADAGATISVADTTKNQGAGTAGASVTEFYFSSDIVLDAGDTLLGSRAVSQLAPGTASTATTPLTLPTGTAVGIYYVMVQADADAAVAETEEGNNTAFTSIRLGPDLLVSALSAPTAVAAGSSISINDTTKNQGGGAAGASTTKFYFSSDTTLDGGDTLLGSRPVPALAGSATNSGLTSVTIPTGIAVGIYYLIAEADAADTVAETHEGNNTALTSVRIGSDLIISALSAPTATGAGATITVADTTKNQGGTAGASTTRVYLSTDSILDAGDVTLGSRGVPALGAGDSHSGTTSVTIPAGTAAGSYYLIAKADADDAETESQENNNTALTVTQVGPDLVISALSAPAPPGAGSTISVTDTTKNQGGGTAGASTTHLYFSTDTVLDAADTLLGSRSVVALAAGALNSGSTSVTLPTGLGAGTYYIIAKADGADAIGETQEVNNTGIAAVQIGADLYVSSFSAPATGEAGATISLIDTTKNQSATDAGASTTRFYLSTDAILDAGDVFLGSRAVPALVAGALSSGTTPVTIPASAGAGFYYLIAQADADDVIPETLETNNTALAAIRLGPDLLIASLSTPGGTASGATITVTDTTKNQGGGAAGASTTNLYFSTDPSLDAGDVFLGSRAVLGLPAGSSSSGPTTVTLPDGLAVGIYYIFAAADADDVLAESREDNNTALTAIRIGSDLVMWSLSAPTSATAGDTISVSDTTKNRGGDTAGASTTRFYLSANTVLDAADVEVGSRPITVLPAEAYSSATTAVTIPAGTAAGNYYLIAKADADDVVTETYETNNTALRFVQITP